MTANPGGYTRDDQYVVDRQEHIKSVLEREFYREGHEANPDAAGLALVSGATYRILVVQKGKQVKEVDLRPFICMSLGGQTFLPIAEREQLRTLIEGSDVDEAFPFEELDLRLRIDWEEITKHLPKLRAPLLKLGERIFLSQAEEEAEGASDGDGQALYFGYSNWGEDEPRGEPIRSLKISASRRRPANKQGKSVRKRRARS
jgi:hypothetical protein